MRVDGLLPDDVVRAGDGELAAEHGLGGQVDVGDHAVDDNVVRPGVEHRGHGQVAVVKLAEMERRG